MVDIISKRDGPRREDVAAKRHLEQNWGTVAKLADTLSNGAYSAARNARQAPAAPEAEKRIIHGYVGTGTSSEARPYVRISQNNRVVMVDFETGRQMHFLGEIRRTSDGRHFALATSENRFFSPLDPEIAAKLADLDKRDLGPQRNDSAFATEISQRLGID